MRRTIGRTWRPRVLSSNARPLEVVRARDAEGEPLAFVRAAERPTRLYARDCRAWAERLLEIARLLERER